MHTQNWLAAFQSGLKAFHVKGIHDSPLEKIPTSLSKAIQPVGSTHILHTHWKQKLELGLTECIFFIPSRLDCLRAIEVKVESVESIHTLHVHAHANTHSLKTKLELGLTECIFFIPLRLDCLRAIEVKVESVEVYMHYMCIHMHTYTKLTLGLTECIFFIPWRLDCLRTIEVKVESVEVYMHYMCMHMRTYTHWKQTGVWSDWMYLFHSLETRLSQDNRGKRWNL